MNKRLHRQKIKTRRKNQKYRKHKAIANRIKKGETSDAYYQGRTLSVKYTTVPAFRGLISNMYQTFKSSHPNNRRDLCYMYSNLITSKFDYPGVREVSKRRMGDWIYSRFNFFHRALSSDYPCDWHSMVNKFNEYKWTKTSLIEENGSIIESTHFVCTQWNILKRQLIYDAGKMKSWDVVKKEYVVGIDASILPEDCWNIIFSFIDAIPDDLLVYEPWVRPITLGNRFLVYVFQLEAGQYFKTLLCSGFPDSVVEIMSMYYNISKQIRINVLRYGNDTDHRWGTEVIHKTYQTPHSFELYRQFKDVRCLGFKERHKILRIPDIISHPMMPWLFSEMLCRTDFEFISHGQWCRSCLDIGYFKKHEGTIPDCSCTFDLGLTIIDVSEFDDEDELTNVAVKDGVWNIPMYRGYYRKDHFRGSGKIGYNVHTGKVAYQGYSPSVRLRCGCSACTTRDDTYYDDTFGYNNVPPRWSGNANTAPWNAQLMCGFSVNQHCMDKLSPHNFVATAYALQLREEETRKHLLLEDEDVD